jgi:hypothetical protein
VLGGEEGGGDEYLLVALGMGAAAEGRGGPIWARGRGSGREGYNGNRAREGRGAWGSSAAGRRSSRRTVAAGRRNPRLAFPRFVRAVRERKGYGGRVARVG